jgi:hypothetical protein
MTRVQVVEGDTDSLYFAIAGDPNLPNSQGFRAVIKDQDFYNQHIYEWATSDFFTSDNSNPTFNSPRERSAFDKKLLGLAIEKQSDSMIAHAPKVYCAFDEDGSTHSRKVKGVSLRQNNITTDDYKSVLIERTTKKGQNTNLNLHKGQMSKITIMKDALTASHTKMRVMKDFSTCAPLLNGVTFVN